MYFNEHAPHVKLVKNLSAKATATSKYIRIREDSEFDQADINQLLNHEAYIHVATTINGRKQNNMKILGANYGSVTKTQEGLAVFSEFISGSIDVDRLKRISDRTIAIQMAIEGADFIDVYNYFIKEVELEGDKRISKKITSQGNIEKSVTNKTPYILSIDTQKLIEIMAKDSLGNSSIYKITIIAKTSLINENKNKIKEKVFNKTFTFNTMDNKFDQLQYQKNIEDNLIKKISDELIIFLYY